MKFNEKKYLIIFSETIKIIQSHSYIYSCIFFVISSKKILYQIAFYFLNHKKIIKIIKQSSIIIKIPQKEHMQKKQLILFRLLLSTFLLIINTHSQNLIKDGNFSLYTLSYVTPQMQKIGIFSSNYSGWYNQNGDKIEIKDNVYNMSIGRCVDLITSVPYYLCQDVQLVENLEYQIGFLIGNALSINYSIIFVTVDQAQVMNFTVYGQYAILYVKEHFVARSNMSTICFSSIQTRVNYSYMTKGPLLKNITLTPYIQKKIQVQCMSNGPEYIEHFTIQCNIDNFSIQFIEYIKANIKVDIEGDTQKYLSVSQIDNSLVLTVSPKKSYKLTNLTISTPSQLLFLNGTYYQFNFLHESLPVTFTYQQENQLKIIKLLYPVADKLISATHSVFVLARSCFVSYFLVNIISFWNLSLLYNLLKISSVPLFLKRFYQDLLYNFSNLTSITNWLNDNISFLNDKLNFSNVLDREHITEKKNGFGWFGYYGGSSQFLSNNFQQIITMGLLILKLILLKFISKVICNSLKILFPKRNIDYVSIFIQELLIGIIFMTVSAVSQMTNSGYMNPKEKLNCFLQNMTLWGGIIMYPIFVIVEVRIKKFKYIVRLKKKLVHEHEKIDLKNIQRRFIGNKQFTEIINKNRNRRIKKIIIIHCLDNLLALLLYLLVPFLIFLDHTTTFFLILTPLFWVKCWWFFKFRKFTYKNKYNLFKTLNLLIWLVHHHIYLAFYIFEQIQQNSINEQTQNNIYDIIKICGYMSIFTILMGGLLEIINFLVSMILEFKLMIKQIWKNAKDNKIRPGQQEEKVKSVQQNRVVLTFIKNQDNSQEKNRKIVQKMKNNKKGIQKDKRQSGKQTKRQDNSRISKHNLKKILEIKGQKKSFILYHDQPIEFV